MLAPFARVRIESDANNFNFITILKRMHRTERKTRGWNGSAREQAKKQQKGKEGMNGRLQLSGILTKRQTSNKNVGKRTVISELFWQTTIILVGSGESTQGEKRAVHYFLRTAVVIDPDGSIALDYRYYSVLQ